MSPPRILVNALALAQGGGRSHLTNVLRQWALDDRGFRYTVLAPPGLLDEMDTRGVDVEILKLPDVPLRQLLRVGYEEVALPFRARSFDLLFCAADLLPRFALAPAVVLVRNSNIYDRRWYDDARMRALAGLVKWGLPNARRILFPTRAAADMVASHVAVPADRIRVVHYGISLEVFEGPAPHDDDALGARYLFLPAAMERHKNIGVLIECLQDVGDPKLEAWIAGNSLLDPAYRGELERRAEDLGVAGRVRFLGPVPYHHILAYYRSAVAFVFPSHLESFGHPILEAMASGTPAIVSDIPSSREIAGDAVLYFPPSDPQALARCVDRVLTRAEETRARVARGLELATGFSWKRTVDGMARVFDEAIRER